MIEEISYKEWKKKYKPRVIEAAGEGRQYVNLDGSPAYSWFDTNKEDYDIMMKHAEPNTVWTERYDEDDKPYLTSGVGVVDRFCYYVSEVSHEGKEVLVSDNL
tara:strand:- start:1425 stop:1733 length:309 start_codon:yes stop_codon:yes gene_type:complete